MYGAGGITLKQFENFLINRRQYILISKTDLKEVLGSVIGPLLFLIYINHLQNDSNLLDAIMFIDNADNVFYAEENTKALFDTANIELQKIVSDLHPISYL